MERFKMLSPKNMIMDSNADEMDPPSSRVPEWLKWTELPANLFWACGKSKN